MRKALGGFGMVLLVVVMAVVLMLVARSWQSVAPTAIEVSNPGSPAAVDDRGQTEAGAAVRSGQLPDLGEMRQATDDHADRVRDALKDID